MGKALLRPCAPRHGGGGAPRGSRSTKRPVAAKEAGGARHCQHLGWKRSSRRVQTHGLTSARIINISTGAAQTFATHIPYGASNAAWAAFTRSTAVELGPLGITVNAYHPDLGAEREEQLLPWIPLGRVDTREESADAACFFASDGARWITGQVLAVSGRHAL